MCSAITCRVCGKTTWTGCGSHVDAVRATVRPEDWCGGHAAPAEQPEQNAEQPDQDKAPEPAPAVPGATYSEPVQEQSAPAPAAAEQAEAVDGADEIDWRTAGGIGATLAAGVLALIAARRAAQRRRRKPGQQVPRPAGEDAQIEAQLRTVADQPAVDELDLVLRAVALWASSEQITLPEMFCVRVTDEQIALYLAAPAAAELPAPFVREDEEGTVWTIESGQIEGLERVRFTSPHPAAFTDDVIEAMAETPNVMPSLHMPLQSGSDRVLRAMRRSYRADRFLGIIERVRAAIPDAAITTDIIVGFPGETEADFEETLRVVRESRFSSAFSFQYSIRPGTPAATMDEQIPKAVVQDRFDRLIALQEEISWAENRAQEGRTLEVLVATGEGRKDTETARISGRARDNRLVHLALPPGLADADRPRPGDMVEVDITYGAPHHLVADSGLDGGTYSVRRTRGGDAWQALQDAAADGTPTGAAKPAVSLGMPSIGQPQMPVATAPACAAN